MAARRAAPIARGSLVALLAVAAMVLTAAASCTPEPKPTVTVTVTATAEPTVEPTAEPDAPEPEPIILSSAGIGAVALNTAAALPTLLTLLGPADDDGTGVEQPGTDECGGPGNLSYVRWGDLQVILTSGFLYGWTINGLDIPEGVTTLHGIIPGAPYSDVLAIPGAPAPGYLDNFGLLITSVDGIGYWSSEGSDPAATVVSMIAVNPITCG